MEQLRKDLANGQFQKCYLLYGEEDYLKRLYRQKIKDAVLSPGDTMNFSVFEGKGISVSALIDLAETLPFFAERRLILIENSGFFKTASQQLADYLPNAPETTLFLFVENEVDKRGKLFKTVNTIGRAVSLDRQKEKTLELWVLGLLKKEHKQITHSTLQLFFSKTGLDMDNIRQELEKLLSYCLEEDVITADHVNAVCSAKTPDQIFGMIDAISAKQTKRAIELYYDLLLHKEQPLRILALLVRQFRILLRLKDMRDLGYPSSIITQKAGLPSFVVRKSLQQASHFTVKDLKDALGACASTEESIKTGQITDRLGVELLIVTYSS